MLDLDAIEARANAATKGPWKLGPAPMWDVDFPDGEPLRESWYGADAKFIAAARTDVPALVAEVRRLHAVMLPLCAAARAAVNGIEPMVASVDDLLCDLKRTAAEAERAMAGIGPDAPEPT